ncbi:MAG: FxsA family protein, partial [Planctomycetota bacterium]
MSRFGVSHGWIQLFSFTDKRYRWAEEAELLGRLILIFILVPLADLILLMVMSSYTGWAVSIGLVILSGIVGAYLARRSTSAV